MKGVFTIGIDRRFADELAQGVLAEHGGDPLALADVLILVPTRRSVRALLNIRDNSSRRRKPADQKNTRTGGIVTFLKAPFTISWKNVW